MTENDETCSEDQKQVEEPKEAEQAEEQPADEPED